MKTKRIIFLFLILAVFMTALVGCENAYKLSFSSEEYTVISGIEFVPEVKIRPKDTEYELTTSNITIAKVKDKTTIITLREGVVDITVTSGKKSATSKLYIDNDIEYDSGNIKFADTVTISFILTNYQLAKLSTESYGIPISVIKGGYANVPKDPFINGYIVHHWYTDRACTKKFDETQEINSDITLFAYLEERETSYIISNGLVSGLTYKHLAHSVLNLPKTTLNGDLIVGIADNAFYNDSQIVTVNIPNTYKTIGNSAFAGCENLVDVNYTGGESQLEVVGTNAFGEAEDDKGKKIVNAKFTTFSLPDTVYEIGGYAFYKCENLSFDGIPENLDKINQFAFANTKINNIDFSNIGEILEGAFVNCKILDTVSNTGNVTHCYKSAFTGTKLYYDSVIAYRDTKPQNDALAVFYADTIAFGLYPGYGKNIGTGDIVLKENCTLIADNAFFGDNFTEITLYLTTDKANNALDTKSYYFLGYDIMKIADGTKIVVPKDKVSAYKARYFEYIDIICYEDIKTFANADSVNYGTHKVLVFENENHALSYYYHRYKGEAKKVDLNGLGYAGATFIRISSLAFNQTANLEEINLGKVEKIADMAITMTCANLKKIILTSCVTPPVLDNQTSFQIGNITNCKVYVKNASEKNTYITAWKNYVTIANRLTYEGEI